MVLKEKVCDICKYHVCSEEEYLSAPYELRQLYARNWNNHINSKSHDMEVAKHNRRKHYHLNVEGKEVVLREMNDKYATMLNKDYPYLLPDNKKIKTIHFEFYDEDFTKYCDDIFKENGFVKQRI